MARLDDLLKKIPKPVFVVGVILIALAVMIKIKPLKNGCDIEILNFTEDVRGYLLKSPRTKTKKLVLPQVGETKRFCKEGNSPGACENYFLALKKVEEAFVRFDDKCLPQLVGDENFMVEGAPEETASIIKFQLKEGVKILALLAWGEKPPAGLADRAGWLSRSEVYTFCRLKTVLVDLIGDEEFKIFRAGVLREYPDVWPEKLQSQINSTDIHRPTALKWSGNSLGKLDEKEVLQRSLFSLRCDQYQ
ncbi:MAG: hypothetical protein H7Z71_05315 [Moraxellaceae bacterium]|nr:hypothetical protein [Pseudobdellovibrionaceae bacterium]